MTKYLAQPPAGKWYGLHYFDEKNRKQPVPIDELEDIAAEFNLSAVGDHCFNPRIVLKWCERNGVCCIEDGVLDMLIGRWALNHDGWQPLPEDGS